MDDKLKDKIEYLREEMIRIACAKGINSKEAIEVSRKLDKLLNELNDMYPEADIEQFINAYSK